MHYVYVLESQSGAHHYVGVTSDLRNRLASHNEGRARHTSKFRPWRVRTYIAFDDADRAFAFESYLKSGSGCAFGKRRL